MMNTIKALSKQFFGAKYESFKKSLLAAAILFIAIYTTEFRVAIAPFILYLTSTFFTSSIMWQMLTGRRHMEIMQGMFALPFENRSFVLSYVLVLGAHTVFTKTLLIWALFFAAASWSWFEIVVALICGCSACMVTAAVYRLYRKGHIFLLILWVTGILAVILMVGELIVVLAIALLNSAGATLYLSFADAYDFYSIVVENKYTLHRGQSGNVFVYLIRYLMMNKSYLINTIGLCVIACFLPLLFGGFQELNVLPIGLAVLCLNTPICTLVSSDSDLELAIRMLPRQTGQFCRKYCLFIFAVNEIIAIIYLCSWKLINGGINITDVVMSVLFALQSAILSVTMEWKRPIRGWKTESDLWHHPRKYIVPLVMMLMAAFVGTWTSIFWIWSFVLLMECCVLLYMTRG